LPDVVYSHGGSGVLPNEPTIEGQPLTAFVALIFDRLSCFVEEVTAHLLQKRLIEGITITEVPLAQRHQDMPERFRVTLTHGGLPPWNITFHASSFEEA
jgi:hypothetical protein